MKNYRIIGLTGQSGSGKSTAAAIMKNHGCAIIDADLLARRAVQKGSLCLELISSVFGSDILDENGELRRRELARRAFASKERTQMLNSITHPFIISLLLDEIRKASLAGKSNIVFDAPMLFESGCDILCDEIIALIAPEDVRIGRISKRDGLSESDIRLRLKNQHNEDFFRQKADHIIDGSMQLNDIDRCIKNILGI